MLSWVAFLLLFIKMIALQRFFLKYISIFFNTRNLKFYSLGVAIRTSCTDCLKKILLHCVYCISVLCTGKDCNVWLHETEYLITWFYFFIIHYIYIYIYIYHIYTYIYKHTYVYICIYIIYIYIYIYIYI